ncbi:MAG: FAD:protein FMN transferase [Terrimesophilobacter sp.]
MVDTVRFTFSTMGTVVSTQWQQSQPMTSTESLISAEVEKVFADFNLTFSLYLEDSELSRIARGALKLEDSSEQMRSVYAQALEWRSATLGAFTPHRRDGVIDLNGIVKALAIERSGTVFEEAGVDNWSVNAGGDVLCGTSTRGHTVGIVDPADRQRLLCAVTLGTGRRAMATSGNAERGDHIWALTPSAVGVFAQVTVMATDIVTADVLATAIVAGGPETLDDVTSRWDVDVLTIDSAGSFRATPGFQGALERSDHSDVG